MSSSSIWKDTDSQSFSSSLSINSEFNIYQLLAQREVCPRTKLSFKKFRGVGSTCKADSDRIRSKAATDAGRGLISWVEAESMRRLSAKYCPLLPPPRSTIAAAFSPDGHTLASTHGDHTVKLIDWQTGRCLKVLSGHRRTPWVVRFHPSHPELLASGSLDNEVRLWDAKSSKCLASHDFNRPIASIAFHAQEDILAVASGHRLYIWHYNRRGESSFPTIILKTKRSLRAVHFHPRAAPFLLTAEVNDLDSSDSSMTFATSPRYLHYPPTVYLTDGHPSPQPHQTNILPAVSLPFLIWPSRTRLDGRSPVEPRNADRNADSQQRVDTSGTVRLLTYSTPSGQYELLISPIEGTDSPPQEPRTSGEIENTVSHTEVDAMESDGQPENRGNEFFPFSDPAYSDMPLMQGWLASENQGSQPPIHSQSGAGVQSISNHVETPTVSNLRTSGRSGSRRRPSRNVGPSRFHSEIATSLAAAAAELPCTVKLRIWPHDIKDPCAPLQAAKSRLTIPHAVLCSEMGAHFSPCGRFLAACVACVLPNMESEPGSHGMHHSDVAGSGTSPTRHPLPAHQIMYELRIYSIMEATFGLVLASRAIGAAHCLTSIQFSPTSDLLLLAYGRRHKSLLKNVVIDGETTEANYTILEVYRVSDLELVRVLPSAEDEVNVACFHPLVGNGLVYGTKEGKLRIFHCDASQAMDHASTSFSVDRMLEVSTCPLEG